MAFSGYSTQLLTLQKWLFRYMLEDNSRAMAKYRRPTCQKTQKKEDLCIQDSTFFRLSVPKITSKFRKDSTAHIYHLSETQPLANSFQLELKSKLRTSKPVVSALAFSKPCKEKVSKPENRSALYHPSYRQGENGTSFATVLQLSLLVNVALHSNETKDNPVPVWPPEVALVSSESPASFNQIWQRNWRLKEASPYIFQEKSTAG